jgi:hypothetical protein
MQLSLKKSSDKWIDIETEGDPVRLKVDYPTREQSQELQSIAFSDKYSGNDKMLKYAQLFIRYAVKDWEGILDGDDKKLECKVIDNELEEELWWGLVQKPEQAMNLYLSIAPEIEFTEQDKKK